jgi:hypothetical protein
MMPHSLFTGPDAFFTGTKGILVTVAFSLSFLLTVVAICTQQRQKDFAPVVESAIHTADFEAVFTIVNLQILIATPAL